MLLCDVVELLISATWSVWFRNIFESENEERDSGSDWAQAMDKDLSVPCGLSADPDCALFSVLHSNRFLE